MPITPASYAANGDTLEYSGPDAHFEAARDWLNGGIVTADIDAEAIQRDHIVRPRFWGVPHHGMVGRVHRIRQMVLADAESQASTSFDIARCRDRTSFKPFRTVPGDTQRWRTRYGRTVYLPTQSHVEVSCQGMVYTNNGTGFTRPHNDTGDLFGRLVLAYLDRQDLGGGILLLQDSSHEIEPRDRCHFSCRSLTTLSAGSYDFLLLYDRQNIAPDHDEEAQVDLRTVNFTLDAYPTVTT